MGMRFTVDQNMVLRYVPANKLVRRLQRPWSLLTLAPQATTPSLTSPPALVPIFAKGISASRKCLAGELRTRLAAKAYEMDEAVRGLRIKVSGCFNSCGQHHVASIGFYGVSVTGMATPCRTSK